MGLSQFKKDFERLRADSIIRPSAHYSKSKLGVVLTIIRPSQNMQLPKTSHARLSTGKSTRSALEDVRLLYFFAGTIKTGAKIDSTMLYTKLCMAGTVPIWGGLVLDKWRAEHLIEIQSILIRHNLLKTIKPALLSITIGSTPPMFESLKRPKDQRRGFLRDVGKF